LLSLSAATTPRPSARRERELSSQASTEVLGRFLLELPVVSS